MLTATQFDAVLTAISNIPAASGAGWTVAQSIKDLSPFSERERGYPKGQGYANHDICHSRILTYHAYP